MNKVILLSRLVNDPELKYMPITSLPVATFRVAVNRKGKKDEADFINCVAFNKTAETIAQCFSKGQQMLIEGHITTGSYQAKDGTKRYTTEVTVETFSFVGNKKSDKESAFDEPIDDGNMPW